MPGLLLWERKAGVEKGEERGGTQDIKTPGGNVGHVVLDSGNGAECEWSGMDGTLDSGKTTKQAACSGAL